MVGFAGQMVPTSDHRQPTLILNIKNISSGTTVWDFVQRDQRQQIATNVLRRFCDKSLIVYQNGNGQIKRFGQYFRLENFPLRRPSALML